MKTNVQCVEKTLRLKRTDRKNEKEHGVEGDPTSDATIEQINGSSYTFDTANCAMTFKKLMDIFGSSFADQ
jgi:hypothetical protein